MEINLEYYVTNKSIMFKVTLKGKPRIIHVNEKSRPDVYNAAKVILTSGLPQDEILDNLIELFKIENLIQTEDLDQFEGFTVVKEDNEVLSVNYKGIDIPKEFWNRVKKYVSLKTPNWVNPEDSVFDLPIENIQNFYERLSQNPSESSKEQLMRFIQANDLPVTKSGTFLTYKKVRSDYRDIHSNTFDNSIGKTVTMDRSYVVEDPGQTCASGLHVCSKDYLGNFSSGSGDRVVICEVDPKNVVSVPRDYNGSKMRVCEYTVIGELEPSVEEIKSSFATSDSVTARVEAKKETIDTKVDAAAYFPTSLIEDTEAVNLIEGINESYGIDDEESYEEDDEEWDGAWPHN